MCEESGIVSWTGETWKKVVVEVKNRNTKEGLEMETRGEDREKKMWRKRLEGKKEMERAHWKKFVNKAKNSQWVVTPKKGKGNFGYEKRFKMPSPILSFLTRNSIYEFPSPHTQFFSISLPSLQRKTNL